MKATYRGYEIEAKRERCMGGWSMLYYSITRQSDGWRCLDSFEDSGEKVRDMIGHLKGRIDNEHETDDPWGEKADAL